jgi:hypothetical protein
VASVAIRESSGSGGISKSSELLPRAGTMAAARDGGGGGGTPALVASRASVQAMAGRTARPMARKADAATVVRPTW